MKKIFTCFICLVLLLQCGCIATSTAAFEKAPEGTVSSSGKNVVGYAKVYNNGVFLFYFFPLWSGNPNRPNRRKYHTLRHEVKDKYMYMMLESLRQTVKGKALEEVEIKKSDSGLFTLWIFWRRCISATAVIVR